MKIKMLVLDMDDTLLKNDLSISEYTVKKINELSQNALVVLASGRVPFAMKKYFKLLKMDIKSQYAICTNGSNIIKTDTNDIIFEKLLDTKLALEAYRLADKLNLSVQIYGEDTIYVSFRNEYTDIDSKLTGMKVEIIKDFENLILNNKVTKLVITGEPEKLKDAQKEYVNLFSDVSNIFISKPFFLEIMPKNTDKVEALKVLSSKLNIDKSEIMAVGDAMNDKGMIEYAEVGVAMANAVDEIKNISDITLKYTNEQDGIGRLIDEYLL